MISVCLLLAPLHNHSTINKGLTKLLQPILLNLINYNSVFFYHLLCFGFYQFLLSVTQHVPGLTIQCK